MIRTLVPVGLVAAGLLVASFALGLAFRQPHVGLGVGIGLALVTVGAVALASGGW